MKFSRDAFGAKTMETITWGLYDGNLNCIREYVQNGIDAKDDTDIVPKKVDVYFENGGNDLVIEDDGPGMNRLELEEALKVGITKKKIDKDVGWRGIGIWSGVPASKRIVIITKKQHGEKLRLAIDNLKLKNESTTNRPAYKVLSEVTGDIEVLPIRKNEENSHYTLVRLESILGTQRSLFNEAEVKEYLIKNVPLSFDKKKFHFAKKIDEELKKHDIAPPEISITFKGKTICKYPNKTDIFLNHIFYKEFIVDDEKVAFGWFLSTNNNKVLRAPNRGIFFKKKGFTIGNENTVKGLVYKIYNPWQYGEIHILSNKIKENAARNNFEYSDDPIVLKFLDDVKEYVETLINANHYQSDKSILDVYINKVENIISKGEIDKASEEIEKIKNRKLKSKRFPDDDSLSGLNKHLVELSNKNYKRLIRLEKKVKSLASKKPKKRQMGDLLKNRIECLPDESVKSSVSQMCSNGVLNPELNVMSSVIKLLKKKTGLKENELSKLTQSAYGWETIKKSNKRPLLTITNGMNEWRDRCLGVMAYSLQELFVNPKKHEEGHPSVYWFESLKPEEQEEVLADLVSSIGLVYRLIEKSTFRQPP